MANPYEEFGYAGSQPAPAPQAENPYASIGHADTQTAAEALDKLSRGGPIDKLADIAGEIAPYIMPVEGFAGAAAGEAASGLAKIIGCLLYTSPSPRDRTRSRMPSSA